MAKIKRVIESVLYVDDLARAAAFYKGPMQLETVSEQPTLNAFDVGGESILILFLRGASLKTQDMPDGGTIPPHDGTGPSHLAFAIDAGDVAFWEARFKEHNIAIEGRTTWPAGGQSLYFRDPDGHLLELATPGIWRTY